MFLIFHETLDTVDDWYIVYPIIIIIYDGF